MIFSTSWYAINCTEPESELGLDWLLILHSLIAGKVDEELAAVGNLFSFRIIDLTDSARESLF